MADIFEAVADPNRRKIMDLLLTAQVAGNELTVSELVTETGLGQPTVSKHLKTCARPVWSPHARMARSVFTQ